MEDCAVDTTSTYPQKWPYRRDQLRLVYFITRFMITLHQCRGIDISKMPGNMLRFYEALRDGKVTEDDIVYSTGGIVRISGMKLDTNTGLLTPGR
jgi:hypothetical protein